MFDLEPIKERVESRNDDGGTEIKHWSVQKARV